MKMSDLWNPVFVLVLLFLVWLALLVVLLVGHLWIQLRAVLRVVAVLVVLLVQLVYRNRLCINKVTVKLII